MDNRRCHSQDRLTFTDWQFLPTEIEVINCTSNKVCDGVFRIELVAGHLAAASHHEYIKLIRIVKDILGYEQGHVETNCLRFIAERNKFEELNKKLSNELLENHIALGVAR
jgi:alanyl-tRNA synthetase